MYLTFQIFSVVINIVFPVNFGHETGYNFIYSIKTFKFFSQTTQSSHFFKSRRRNDKFN